MQYVKSSNIFGDKILAPLRNPCMGSRDLYPSFEEPLSLLLKDL